MQADQCVPERCKLRVPSADLNFARADGVGDEAASSFRVLPRMWDLDLERGVLVEDLLDATIVAAYFGLDLRGSLWPFIVQFFVTEIGRAREEVGSLVRRRVSRWGGRWLVEAFPPSVAPFGQRQTE